MKEHNLNKGKKLAHYPMTSVMAQVWILSTVCRHRTAGRGLLRDAWEVLE